MHRSVRLKGPAAFGHVTAFRKPDVCVLYREAWLYARHRPAVVSLRR
uniref:Uncharacterized protein n=1 Tax=Faecalibaculum rodentium TaxID=1702221 RepID=A0A140DZ14_9FIRM|nr:hypothetical protein AALO17_27570 [Faecalibaculum rodentium]